MKFLFLLNLIKYKSNYSETKMENKIIENLINKTFQELLIRLSKSIVKMIMQKVTK